MRCPPILTLASVDAYRLGGQSGKNVLADLTSLPPGERVVGPEVRPVLCVIARLVVPPQAYPCHNVRAVEERALHEQPEGVGGRYVGEGVLCRRDGIVEARRVGHDLGQLSAGRAVTGAEVGAVLVVARLVGIDAARVSRHDLTVGQPLYPLPNVEPYATSVRSTGSAALPRQSPPSSDTIL